MPQSFDTTSPDLGPAIERQFQTACSALLDAPGIHRTPDFFRIITGEPHPLGNFAIITDPTNASHTAAAIEPLAEIIAPAAAVFPGMPSPESDAALKSRGFVLAETMPAMAVDIDRLAPTPLPDGCTFREIDPEREAAPWCQALAAGYPLPLPVAEAFGPPRLHLPDGCEARFFAVTRDDRMIATSLLFLDGDLAGIYGVATLPDHRSRGLGAAATAEPLRFARTRGYRTGILQSSAMGEPVYKRLGFVQLGGLPLYVRMPENTGG